MVYEEQGIEGLFNALQCKVTLFDIRSEDEYKKSRARGSINVPNLESIDNQDCAFTESGWIRKIRGVLVTHRTVEVLQDLEFGKGCATIPRN